MARDRETEARGRETIFGTERIKTKKGRRTEAYMERTRAMS